MTDLEFLRVLKAIGEMFAIQHPIPGSTYHDNKQMTPAQSRLAIKKLRELADRIEKESA